MAQIALSVIGIITGSILGVIPIAIPDDRPGVTDPLAAGNSLVRFGIGLNANTSIKDTMGGRVPSIKVFNEHKELIGSAPSPNSSFVGPGAWTTVVVDQQGSGKSQQATFLEIAGSDVDPVCLSYIGQTWSDGTKLAWLGDIGFYCKKPWYYSDLYVTMTNGTMYKPYCMWVGRGFGYDPRNATQPLRIGISALTIHTPNFGRQTASGGISVPTNPSSLCQEPSMAFFNQSRFVFASAAGSRLRPLAFFTMFDFFGMVASATGSIVDRVPRFIDPPQVKEAFGGTLISSHDAQHTGKELCENPFSFGPDFVSFSDNTFCDMETKTAWPLCDKDHLRGCFDWDTKSLVIGMFRRRELKYNKFVKWRS